MTKKALGFAAAIFAATGSFASAQVKDFKPVTADTLKNPNAADWLMINRTYDQQRYSPLNQINKSNVKNLGLAWSRGMPAGTQESTPIVYNGVIYVVRPGAAIQALNGVNGDLLWEYNRNYPKEMATRSAGRTQRAPRASRSSRT